MKKPIQISIPTPCHENWANMTPADKGRFCGMCQKNVIDFTRSSDREIASVFTKDINLCGRFNSNQLERELIIPAEKRRLWPVAAAVVSFLSLGITAVNAQEPAQTEQHPQKGETLGKAAYPVKAITGTITDTSGPMPGVTITIEGTQIAAQTDFDGYYTLNAKQGDTLVFTDQGYVTVKQAVTSVSATISIQMEEAVLEGVVLERFERTSTSNAIAGGIRVYRVTAVEKRTFFGRIFHSIGNLFR